jgi:hypothetical protein
MIAFKFLRDGRVAPFSRVRWPAPAGGEPGAWVLRAGPGGVCAERVHACRIGDLPEWIDTELWTVELDGDVDVQCGKLVADRGRLLTPVDTWDTAAAAELATACALRARDAAIAVLGPGPQADSLHDHAGPHELLAATAALASALGGDAARATAYAGDAARHATTALAQPATAPGHAATAAFIAAHAAALAAGDPGAAESERAWQASWLADRLELAS